MRVSRGLPTFPVRAPGLVDEDLFASNLVDMMRHHQEGEECEPADREQEVDGIPQDCGEEAVHGTERINHSIVPLRTSFRRRGTTFLREAPARAARRLWVARSRWCTSHPTAGDTFVCAWAARARA